MPNTISKRPTFITRNANTLRNNINTVMVSALIFSGNISDNIKNGIDKSPIFAEKIMKQKLKSGMNLKEFTLTPLYSRKPNTASSANPKLHPNAENAISI